MTRRKKSLSQNFLVDGNLQRKIVEALEPGADDHVLEVGPGTGALTQHLAGRVGTLTLVELDDELASQLAEDYREYDDVEMIHADILDSWKAMSAREIAFVRSHSHAQHERALALVSPVAES